MRLLVVEDQDPMREVLRRVARIRGEGSGQDDGDLCGAGPRPPCPLGER
jgi:hypothetical protein